jgi:hypothetical protein
MTKIKVAIRNFMKASNKDSNDGFRDRQNSSMHMGRTHFSKDICVDTVTIH